MSYLFSISAYNREPSNLIIDVTWRGKAATHMFDTEEVPFIVIAKKYIKLKLKLIFSITT